MRNVVEHEVQIFALGVLQNVSQSISSLHTMTTTPSKYTKAIQPAITFIRSLKMPILVYKFTSYVQRYLPPGHYVGWLLMVIPDSLSH